MSDVTKPELTEIPETELAEVAGGYRFAIDSHSTPDHRGGGLQSANPDNRFSPGR